MELLYQVLGIAAAGLLIWYMFRVVKRDPQSFSKKNFSKSFYTMGLLALGLIAFVGLLVLMLRA